MIPKRYFLAFVLLTSVFYGCSSADFSNTTGESSREDKTIPPEASIPSIKTGLHNEQLNTSLVKYLNRVTCVIEGYACNNESIDEIWSVCIDKGFQATLPTQKIKYSRDLVEMVSEVRSKRFYRPIYKDITDENGIVQTVQAGEEAYKEPYKIEGNCIGSEYILE